MATKFKFIPLYIDAFLEAKAPLSKFKSKMDDYASLNEEICCIRNSAMLNLYELDCHDMNKEMSNR